MMIRSKLSADPTSLVLGIISLAIVIFGCCCGLLGPVALTMSIVGLYQADKSLKEFGQNPEVYDPSSRSNVNAGRILCIIGIVVSSIVMIVYAIYFLVWGFVFSDVVMDTYKNRNNNTFEVQDSTEVYLEKRQDSIANDTSAIRIEPLNE